MGDALDAESECLFDILRIARFARMARQPQAGRAGGLERRPLGACREADLVAGQVETDQASAGVAACFSRQRDVVLDRVLAHGAYDGHRSYRPGREPR